MLPRLFRILCLQCIKIVERGYIEDMPQRGKQKPGIAGLLLLNIVGCAIFL
jgi:hypothetical protein